MAPAWQGASGASAQHQVRLLTFTKEEQHRQMKPQNRSGYSDDYLEFCERTLVTLLRRLGPWKRGIYLVGGLVPIYLIGPSSEEEEREGYMGTQDIDIVLDVAMFGEIDAYKRLEQNLKDAGFKRVTKQTEEDDVTPEHWRWSREIAPNVTVVVDLLQDAEPDQSGRVGPLPKERRLSALGIQGAHLAIQDYVPVRLKAELLDGGGITEETIRVANIVPFVVLKALAYDDRGEPKDANDLIYCLQYYKEGPASVAKAFAESMRASPGEPLIPRAVEILRSCFASDNSTVGEQKDGPVSYARFQYDPARYDQNRLAATAVVEQFLTELARLTSPK